MSYLSSRAARVAVLACSLLVLATPAGAAAADRYVALGDSFSSGVGTGSYTLSSSCRRGVYAYPYLVSQQRPDTALDFVACSGATTSDLMASQIQSVTATVLNPRLDSVYAAIRNQAAADARVVVLGYPRMFTSAGCFGTLGITATERTKANQLAAALDGVIAARAAAYGFAYKGALAPFATHAVCSSSPWLNGLNLFNTTESYHPNRNGNSLGYALLVRSVIG
jgi:hypothetical protein